MTVAAHGLVLRRLTKRYGAVAAMDGIDLEVAPGEFLTLLGPSGSGKTTVLMAIAGFVPPSEGEILLDGRPITHLPAEARNFGVVFQGYALFPHMSVAENVAYPLRVRKVPRAAREERVKAVLRLVQLDALAGRLPRQLSGGQQQRVALARALVFDPNVLLLDEPMSALDKKLRAELQIELRSLHRRIGGTFINVTHDQEEAIAMSDRIAVMRDGRLVQLGRPEELYERPATRFVADFLGGSNFLEGRVAAIEGDNATLDCRGVALRQALGGRRGLAVGDRVTVALRPNRVTTGVASEVDANAVTGQVASALYVGAHMKLVLWTPVHEAFALMLPITGGTRFPREGESLTLSWASDAGVIVEEDG